jgi:hypothetical protein
MIFKLRTNVLCCTFIDMSYQESYILTVVTLKHCNMSHWYYIGIMIPSSSNHMHAYTIERNMV